MIKYIVEDALGYDDVMLIPKYSSIKSRSLVDTSVILSKGIEISNPIVPSNMKTIIGPAMIDELYKHKMMCMLHRFMPIEEQLKIGQDLIVKHGKDILNYLGYSIGIKEEDYKNLSRIIELGVKIICIDVAHGHSENCGSMTKYVSETYPDVLLISGNTATTEGAMFLYECGADVVKCNVGSGCFGAGTRVLMSNGIYKNIEDIRINDYVIGGNGKPVKVINAFCTGNKNVSKIRNNLFYQDTYVTPDHQYWVGDFNTTHSNKPICYSDVVDKKTINGLSKYKWKSIGELKQDLLLIPNKINFQLPKTFKIELKKKIGGNWRTGHKYNIDATIKPSYDSGYLFGTFLGDGCASSLMQKNGSHIGRVNWYFSKYETTIINKVVNSIQNIFNKTPRVKAEKNIFNIYFHYKPLADFLHGWGKKDNKHLPEQYLVDDKKYLQGLWDGMTDSDGHYSKDGRINFGNTSPYLIELYNILSYKLTGIFPNNKKNQKSIGALKGTKLENIKQSYISENLKNGKTRLTEDYQIVKLLEYTETNEIVPVYDITVDNEDHSFIANNTIVHNSICLTRINTGNGMPAITTLIESAEAKKNFENKTGKKVFLMTDGGIKTSGDLVKAMCFADLAMCGNLFSGTNETPSEIIKLDGKEYKSYMGSSTHRGDYTEGVSALVESKGPVKKVIKSVLEGLTSGMSYQGAIDLKQLRASPKFVKITNAGMKESGAHTLEKIL